MPNVKVDNAAYVPGVDRAWDANGNYYLSSRPAPIEKAFTLNDGIEAAKSGIGMTTALALMEYVVSSTKKLNTLQKEIVLGSFYLALNWSNPIQNSMGIVAHRLLKAFDFSDANAMAASVVTNTLVNLYQMDEDDYPDLSITAAKVGTQLAGVYAASLVLKTTGTFATKAANYIRTKMEAKDEDRLEIRIGQ